MKRTIALALTAILVLTACSGKSGRLRDLYDPSAGPEEFAVVPSRTLSIPDNPKALPVPTPGGANLADPTPKADAMAVLGGSVGTAGLAGDAAFITTATRYGITPNIRQSLAQEDAQFRKTQARFSRLKLFRVDRYNQVYRFQTLDASKEVQRWRLKGVKTPSMPIE